MKRSLSACLALASLAAWWGPHLQASRPRYGGTLRVGVQAPWVALDPASWPSDAVAAADAARLVPLVAETLVRLDHEGRLAAGLAASWQRDAGGTRWTFHLREGVRLHDGTVLDAARAASALRLAPGQSAADEGGALVVKAPAGAPRLDWELAHPRRALAWASQEAGPTPGASALVGTGPFKAERWVQGRPGLLRAHDAYWDGRPYLDAVHVEFGRRPRDQAGDIEQGRADMALVLPQDARRLAQRGLRLTATPTREIVALVFDASQPAGGNAQVRRALSASIDRTAICDVLLQRQAEPAHALLPQWMTGYAFLLRPGEDRSVALSLVRALPAGARVIRAHADPSDPVTTAVAGRVAADAREVGLAMTLAASRSSAVDARFLRRRLAPVEADGALAALAASLGVAADDEHGEPAPASALERDARIEVSLVERRLVVPLVHLPDVHAFGSRVQLPAAMPIADGTGGWRLLDVWLRTE